MADKELATVNASGELSGIQLGDVIAGKKVLTQDEIDAKIAPLEGAQDYTDYNPLATAPTEEQGRTYYDADRNSVSYYTDIPGVILNTAVEQVIRIINRTGANIINGTPVRYGSIDGATNLPAAVPAIADSFANAHVSGLATHDIGDDEEGWMTVIGLCSDVVVADVMETGQTMTVGQRLFLSATEAGKMTHTAPDIVVGVGGFFSGIQGTEPGDFFVRTYGVQDFPTLLAYMNNTNADVYNLTTTAQDIINYTDSGNVVLPANTTAGTITASIAGTYDLNFTGSFSFTAITTTRSIYVEIYDVTNTAVVFTYTVAIPRDADEVGASFQIPSTITGSTQYVVRLRASTDIDITFSGVSFGITSKDIR